MNTSQLSNLTFLVLSLCGFVSGFVISQPHSSVRIQPGFPTTFHCHVQAEGHYSYFWIKVPPEGASVYMSKVNALRGIIDMFGEFKNNPRIKVILNKSIFSLSIFSTEPTDIATYICGAQGYEQLYFGNGSQLIVKDMDATEPTMPNEIEEDGYVKLSVLKYAVPVLSATNVASIIVILALIYHLLKRTNQVGQEQTMVQNTDDVSYAALTFNHNKKNTAQKRSSRNAEPVHGALQHHARVEL